MQRDIILKAITIIIFLVLIVCFVGYRGGILNNYFASNTLQGSHNGGTISPNAKDTSAKEQENDKLMMSSSKSIVIKEAFNLNRKRRRLADSAKKSTESIENAKKQQKKKAKKVKQ